jgi:transposase
VQHRFRTKLSRRFARESSLSRLQTCPNSAQGRRKLIDWLRKHQVNKAVMEASGGYERDWAKKLREAGIEVRIVDPKRVRSFAQSVGEERCDRRGDDRLVRRDV